MNRRKGRIARELVFRQLFDAIDAEKLVEIHATLQRSIDAALEGELAADERHGYARRLLRDAWLRIGETVFDDAVSFEAPA